MLKGMNKRRIAIFYQNKILNASFLWVFRDHTNRENVLHFLKLKTIDAIF